MTIKTENNRNVFYQWETGRCLVIDDVALCNEVWFYNTNGNTAYVCQVKNTDNRYFVEVPNIILQVDVPFHAHFCHTDDRHSMTLHTRIYEVLPRPKPEGYAYTEEDVLNYSNLADKLSKLTDEMVNRKDVEAIVARQLTENPITAESIGAVSVSALDAAVDSALALAKESGAFKGDTGATGTDGVSCTHVWNGTVLTVSSASGTSSADLKGDKGDKGATGPAGADGKTPVKGVDYWTNADQESIVQQVITALGTPVFGRVDADNNIILTGELVDGSYTLKYEGADGEQTEIGTVKIGNAYTNWIPLSTEVDGVTPYNGGKGYKENTRFSASGGGDVSAGGVITSGYIPVKSGDIVRLKNIRMNKIDAGQGIANVCNLCVFTALGAGYSVDPADLDTKWGAVWDSDSNLIQIEIKVATTTYIRLNTAYIGEDSILTINEEITD